MHFRRMEERFLSRKAGLAGAQKEELPGGRSVSIRKMEVQSHPMTQQFHSGL